MAALENVKRHCLSFWLALFLLNPVMAVPQKEPEGRFLLRYMRTQVNASLNFADQVCLLIAADGHFRLERLHQPPGMNDFTTRVFDGNLTAQDRQSLLTLLNDEKLKVLASPQDRAAKGDEVFLVISREPSSQKLWLYENDKALKHESVKALLSWLEALQTRKLSELKRATPNRCLAVGSSSPVS